MQIAPLLYSRCLHRTLGKGDFGIDHGDKKSNPVRTKGQFLWGIEAR